MERVYLLLISAAVSVAVATPYALQKEAVTYMGNYGVKERSIGGKIASQVSSRSLFARETAYMNVESWRVFIKEAAESYKIPAETLAAILYEESVHRKPVDVKTFGPAQIGLEELKKQNLPMKRELLEDPESAVWVLARKLHRLRKQTGSLNEAIILHNGYTDFLGSIRSREKDPRLLMILQVEHTYTPTEL